MAPGNGQGATKGWTKPGEKFRAWMACALVLGLILAAARSPGAVAAMTARANQPASDPMAEVKAAIDDAMAAFRDKQMPLPERRKKLRAIAAKHFDFPFMARSALGYHWRSLSPTQRAEFVPLFTKFIEDIYLTRLHDYTVKEVQRDIQTVKIKFIRQRFDGPDYAQVDSEVRLEEGKEPMKVNYRLRMEDGGWRIYDITVDSISVMANYRNQFNRVINNQGYDKLVSDLKKKQETLAASLDK